MTGETKELVEERLRAKHSPDQISGKLALEGVSVSHETIYKHVNWDKKNGGDLWRGLRINSKRRYRRRSKAGRGEKIPDRTDIEERPAEVAERERYGDWEADLIQGGSGSGYLEPVPKPGDSEMGVGRFFDSGSINFGPSFDSPISDGIALLAVRHTGFRSTSRHGYAPDLLWPALLVPMGRA